MNYRICNPDLNRWSFSICVQENLLFWECFWNPCMEKFEQLISRFQNPVIPLGKLQQIRTRKLSNHLKVRRKFSKFSLTDFHFNPIVFVFVSWEKEKYILLYYSQINLSTKHSLYIVPGVWWHSKPYFFVPERELYYCKCTSF